MNISEDEAMLSAHAEPLLAQEGSFQVALDWKGAGTAIKKGQRQSDLPNLEDLPGTG
ncbi:hypothetical protein PHLCEN_2v3251 [Hermanssonia centrifuga]|uniref:Uncharacterized protein n=1 Tax=Hermanssonia centrifuga TaxID=98765 RepID=A0A2R6QXI0_9APHY|nr:hypothetical protein PHLCEN_2v3251 [Hermanssonia centrifuga]